MAEYLVTTEELATVADAIRTKTGSSSPIAFPNGFADALKQKLIRMTVNYTTLDSVAWGGKTYREIFLTGNIFTTGNAITDSTNTGWSQYSSLAKPTSTTARYNTSPSSLNCSGTTSVQMYKELSLTNGNVFYIACKRLLTSYTAGNWLGVEVYYLGGAGKVISDTVNASSVSDTFETVSHTFTPKTATTQIWVGSGGSANLTGYIDDVVCVNMTALFGDNVPSKAQMNSIYETFLRLYKNELAGDEVHAYGMFTDETGDFVSCDLLIEPGETYYAQLDGPSAVCTFEHISKTSNHLANVSLTPAGDVTCDTIIGTGNVIACRFGYTGTSTVQDVTINLDFTVNQAVKKLIAVAEAEVGYLEKASASNLDSKTANPGSANYTKYARDLDAISGFYNTAKQTAAWCDIFTDWCFVQAYGVDKAKQLICHDIYGAGVDISAEYYQNNGQYYTSDPKVGDQIFFVDSSNVYQHTGIVYKVDSTHVYTIEGNTADPTGVNAYNGVYKKAYSLSDSKIDGYGRPNYDIV